MDQNIITSYIEHAKVEVYEESYKILLYIMVEEVTYMTYDITCYETQPPPPSMQWPKLH